MRLLFPFLLFLAVLLNPAVTSASPPEAPFLVPKVVEVTAFDIADAVLSGRACWYDMSPVAVALRRMGYRHADVAEDFIYVRWRGVGIEIDTPLEVVDWFGTFCDIGDLTMIPEPRTFTLLLPP